MELSLVSILVASFTGALIAGLLVLRASRRAEAFPESLKLFSPTSRTIGGPGNFHSRSRDEVMIFGGNGSLGHVISITFENMGDCDIRLGLRDEITFPSTDIVRTVAPGTTVTVCGYATKIQNWSTHSTVTAKCVGSDSSDSACKYRWRVDSLEFLPSSGPQSH